MANASNVLHYLDTLLKTGSFTKTARNLYISQPYLTQTFKRIEKDLGVELINRDSRPIRLTEAGELYYRHLKKMEFEQDDFRKKLYPLTITNGLMLQIGILGTLGSDLLPKFLPDFIERFPKIKVELSEDSEENNERKTISGNLDFFIGQNSELLSRTLISHSTKRMGYYAIIPASSKLYQKNQFILNEDQFDLSLFLQEKLVLTAKNSPVRRNINYLFEKYQIVPQIVLETQNLLSTFNLAKSGLGNTIIPENLMDTEQVKKSYNIFPLSKELISFNFFIAHRTERVLSASDNVLIALFLERIT